MESSGWQLVGETFRSEFSDLTDAGKLTRILLRLTQAALLGGLLGIEREKKGKAAGVRTHMLVAMGQPCLYCCRSKWACSALT